MSANNECCDFGLPLDFYPELANFAEGDYFTYELGELSVTGDLNSDGVLDAADIDALSAALRAGQMGAQYDLNLDGKVDVVDRSMWVESFKRTYFGDSNLDGEFSSSDLVFVFQFGQYEDTVAGNSTWGTGDWNGDGDFTSSDFVTAFSAGGYEAGKRTAVAAVPEPATVTLTLLGLMALFGVRRHSGR